MYDIIDHLISSGTRAAHRVPRNNNIVVRLIVSGISFTLADRSSLDTSRRTYLCRRAASVFEIDLTRRISGTHFP
jgi:hypothetical protein